MATQATRQPGSIFKPFVYLTALQNGYTPCSILMDTPFVLDTGVSLWRPKNFSGRFQGPMTLRYALSRSVNTPTAKLYLDFGLAPVLENVQQAGLHHPPAPGTGPVPGRRRGDPARGGGRLQHLRQPRRLRRSST